MPTLYSSEEDSSAEGMTSASKVRIPTYAGINDYNLLRFVMTAHVVQIMISAKLETRGTSSLYAVQVSFLTILEPAVIT